MIAGGGRKSICHPGHPYAPEAGWFQGSQYPPVAPTSRFLVLPSYRRRPAAIRGLPPARGSSAVLMGCCGSKMAVVPRSSRLLSQRPARIRGSPHGQGTTEVTKDERVLASFAADPPGTRPGRFRCGWAGSLVPSRTDHVQVSRFTALIRVSTIIQHGGRCDSYPSERRAQLPGYLIPFDPATFVLDQWKHLWQMLSLWRVWLGSKNFTSRRAIPLPPSVPLDHYLPP